MTNKEELELLESVRVEKGSFAERLLRALDKVQDARQLDEEGEE